MLADVAPVEKMEKEKKEKKEKKEPKPVAEAHAPAHVELTTNQASPLGMLCPVKRCRSDFSPQDCNQPWVYVLMVLTALCIIIYIICKFAYGRVVDEPAN